jgi:hypothetical protein
MQELSVLLVGGGVMGRNHLRVLTRLGGVKVDAVVDPQTGVEIMAIFTTWLRPLTIWICEILTWRL